MGLGSDGLAPPGAVGKALVSPSRQIQATCSLVATSRCCSSVFGMSTVVQHNLRPSPSTCTILPYHWIVIDDTNRRVALLDMAEFGSVRI
mmetsp:Transcript_28292/g.66344  ORF Transcript_28292/g.66344 Transcript_28292/m.66344 type:complete len:90 (-) Transcript_28292:683-952(-)